MKNYLTKEEIENYIKSNKILIARIADLPNYQGTEQDGQNAYSAKGYLKNGKYGELPIGETENFLPRDDGFTYGWVETKGRLSSDGNSKKNNKINIDNLYGRKTNYDKIDDCLVIFLTLKTGYVVGYYKNATIYRKKQPENYKYNFKIKGISSIEKRDVVNIFFNLKTKNDNAILLKTRFYVEVKKSIKCGQSNIKYVNDKNRNYVIKNVLEKLINKQ